MSKQNLLKMLMSDSQKLSFGDVQQILSDELSKAPEEMDTRLIELCAEAIGNAAKKQKLVDVFKTTSMKLTLDDVRQIMTEELSKGMDEMDTDLIDLCAEAIGNAQKGQKLIAALRSKSLKMTLGDLQRLLDEELSKGMDEMDTDLVELCADAIEKAKNGQRLFSATGGNGSQSSFGDAQKLLTEELSKAIDEKNAETAGEEGKNPEEKNAKSTTKLLLLVAVAAALLASLPSIASRISIKAEGDVVALGDNGDYVVDIDGADALAKDALTEEGSLLSALREAGVQDPVLPDRLLQSGLEFKIETVADRGDYSTIKVEIFNPTTGKSGFVKIKNFNKPLSEQGILNVNSYLGDVSQTRKNELSAVSFSEKDSACTYYTSGNAVYTIFFDK